MTETIRILGIDPGSRLTGYGVVDVCGRTITYVASGCIRTPKGSHIDRLHAIGCGVRELLDLYGPAEAAVEQVFVSKNANSALKLGQARAAAICRILDDLESRYIYEYAPRAIKQATVGFGGASKEQIQHMMKQLLKLTGDLSEDAADALAVAVCHANSRGLNARLRAAAES
ncbi:MAG: crossover junction endodeoxyribonuclease RuvC [Gammaproteobacteria bacterium]